MAVLNKTQRRHMRRTRLDRGHRRGRLRRLTGFGDQRAQTAANGGIGDTSTQAAVTADSGTDLVAEATHGFADGAGPMRIQAATQPGGISDERPYYLDENTAGDYFLVRSRGEALRQQSAEDITSNGVTVTREPGNNAWAFLSMLQAGLHPDVIWNATDLDTLIFT